MPPYKPFASDAQRKKLNAMAGRGEISASEVHGKNEASKGKKLPEKVGQSNVMRQKLFGGK